MYAKHARVCMSSSSVYAPTEGAVAGARLFFILVSGCFCAVARDLFDGHVDCGRGVHLGGDVVEERGGPGSVARIVPMLFRVRVTSS